jgi:uncharacterized repeat protein (TIGR03803 family)
MTIKRLRLPVFAISLTASLAVCVTAQNASPSLRTLHAFLGNRMADGANPLAGVVIGNGPGGRAVLYGATSGGGPSNLGTVFSLAPPAFPGGAWTETILHSFSGPDGAAPVALVIGSDAEGAAVLYGVTAEGGAGTCLGGGCGTVFSLSSPKDPQTNAAWIETVLYSFTGGSDGSTPTGLSFARRTDGQPVLYGTNNDLATAGVGTVFSLTPPSTSGGAWKETVLHTFTGPDGGDPVGGVVVGPKGNVYGTTSSGGATDIGTVFELTPPESTGGTWTETVLHSFSGSDGAFPSAGVLVGTGTDGRLALYGTASLGGTSGDGTVYRLTPSANGQDAWTMTVLYTFAGPDGASPSSSLAIRQGPDGHAVFFGTTSSGGSSGFGTVFSLKPPATPGDLWTETVLHSFEGSPSDGSEPNAGVAIAGDGALFGTTVVGGAANLGTVFGMR